MMRVSTLFAMFVALFMNTVIAAELSPTTVAGATTVDTAAAKKLFDDGAAFIDTRRNSDWDAGRIPDAIHLELKSNFTEASLSGEVGKGDPLVCYCNGHKCLRSSVCTEKRSAGASAKSTTTVMASLHGRLQVIL